MIERTYPPDKMSIQNNRQTVHYSGAQMDIKIDRMSDLNRDGKYLERGMQRMRMTLVKLQQDPTQIPITTRVVSRPKRILGLQDYKDNGE